METETNDNSKLTDGFLRNRISDFWQAVKSGPSKNIGIWLVIVATYRTTVVVWVLFLGGRNLVLVR